MSKKFDYYQQLDKQYSDPSRTMSEINDAGLQILRLHDLWRESRRFREAGQLIKWRWILDSCALELNNDAIRVDNEGGAKYHFIKDLDEIDEEISKQISKRNYYSLYKALFTKEKILRQIQEQAGKGSKLRDMEDDWM